MEQIPADLMEKIAERIPGEMKLFDQWKQSNKPQHFQALYQSMKPLILSAASKASYGSNLPQSAHEIYAAQNFYDALHRFDPSKGVQLQTFVYNAVQQKAKRLDYQYQNVGKIAEPRAIRVGDYNMAKDHLKDTLGRPPSAMELADYLHWSLKDVDLISKEVQKDLSLDGLENQGFLEDSTLSEDLHYLYYELTPQQQLVYELVFGLHGKRKLTKPGGKIDYTAVAKATGFSESKVRTLVKDIAAKYHKVAR
jgi:DNA-directed RNA polymerase specialized sigma subunit